MPRFWRVLCGPRVTVRPQVISGPASPGQQVWTGSLERSTVVAFPDDLLARRARHHFRRHVQHLLQHRQFVPGVLQSLRRLGFLQVGEQLADFAQRRHRFLAHSHCDASGCAEQIAQHRDVEAFWLLEQYRGTLRLQYAVADLGHFQIRRNFGGDALEFTLLFQLGDEVAKIVIVHTERPAQMIGLAPPSIGIMAPVT